MLLFVTVVFANKKAFLNIRIQGAPLLGYIYISFGSTPDSINGGHSLNN